MRLMRWLHIPTIYGIMGLVAAGWYATRIEPRWLRVRHLALDLPLLPRAFDGYRIAHFSDPHLGVPWTDAVLPRVVAAINDAAPDLIAMTGDLITWSRRGHVAPDVAAPFVNLRAPDGMWAVLGNHDYAAPRLVRTMLDAVGFALLCNDAHVLSRGSDQIALVGLDDAVWGQPNLGAAFAAVPPDVPAILLAHEPDIAPLVAAYANTMLQLSGHTHGGQVMPLPGLPLLLPKYGRTHFRGLSTVRHMPLYVTTGTGTGRFVVRWNCPPEIAVITLRCPRAVRPVL